MKKISEAIFLFVKWLTKRKILFGNKKRTNIPYIVGYLFKTF